MGGPTERGLTESDALDRPLLLDTHAWVWWVTQSSDLPHAAHVRGRRASLQRQLWVSAVSAWELALLAQRGHVVLTISVRDWIARSQGLSGLRFLPIDVGIGIRAVELQGLHADPADRMIVASAERLRAVLVTRDERLRAFSGIETSWG